MTDTDNIVVEFPYTADTWIPNLEQLGDGGQIILDVAGQALDHFPAGADSGTTPGTTRGTPYQRRLLTTGQIVPMIPNQDGQLTVSLFEVFIGRAGEQRFQFYKGSLGTMDQRVARYLVQLTRKSPTVQGGIAPRMAATDDLVDYARTLWVDGYVVWSALLAMCLGGVKNSVTGAVLSPGPLVQDNVLIGPMTLDPPAGGLATAKIEVIVQM